MSERFKELVLKTSDLERDREFESHPLRQKLNRVILQLVDAVVSFYMIVWRSTQAGRRGAPAKGVGRSRGARVQIPPSPPNEESA